VLSSPGRSSGRVIPPSLYPVVPAQRARLGLRRPAIRPAETAVHQIFEVPPVPVHLLGTDLPEVGAAAPDSDGEGWDGRPRSIGPLGGSANGLSGGVSAGSADGLSGGVPAAVEPPAAAGAASVRTGSAPRRRPWWRRP